jgi:hypothetical protein
LGAGHACICECMPSSNSSGTRSSTANRQQTQRLATARAAKVCATNSQCQMHNQPTGSLCSCWQEPGHVCATNSQCQLPPADRQFLHQLATARAAKVCATNSQCQLRHQATGSSCSWRNIQHEGHMQRSVRHTVWSPHILC